MGRGSWMLTPVYPLLPRWIELLWTQKSQVKCWLLRECFHQQRPHGKHKLLQFKWEPPVCQQRRRAGGHCSGTHFSQLCWRGWSEPARKHSHQPGLWPGAFAEQPRPNTTRVPQQRHLQAGRSHCHWGAAEPLGGGLGVRPPVPGTRQQHELRATLSSTAKDESCLSKWLKARSCSVNGMGCWKKKCLEEKISSVHFKIWHF